MDGGYLSPLIIESPRLRELRLKNPRPQCHRHLSQSPCASQAWLKVKVKGLGCGVWLEVFGLWMVSRCLGAAEGVLCKGKGLGFTASAQAKLTRTLPYTFMSGAYGLKLGLGAKVLLCCMLMETEPRQQVGYGSAWHMFSQRGGLLKKNHPQVPRICGSFPKLGVPFRGSP